MVENELAPELTKEERIREVLRALVRTAISDWHRESLGNAMNKATEAILAIAGDRVFND